VDTGAVEGFVGVDVAETAEEGLVEQKRLNAGATGAKPGGEIGGGDFERVGTKIGGMRRKEPEISELADVVEEQSPVGGRSSTEQEYGAGIGSRLGVHEQRSCHAERDKNGS